jgi:Uma2 family endonuclease
MQKHLNGQATLSTTLPLQSDRNARIVKLILFSLGGTRYDKGYTPSAPAFAMPTERTSERLGKIPPLESGDRLTRDEFERRYTAMPALKKAELIEGVVYVASPLRANAHGKPHGVVMTWLGTYSATTPGVDFYDNPTVRLDMDNELQPDAVLRLEWNGRSHISEDDYIEGEPELIVEIAASSASYDLHDKLRVYRRNGVKEYIVWRTYGQEIDSQQIDWFYLEDGEYQTRSPNSSGILCCPTFPGLWLAKDALLAGELAEVLRVVQQGIASSAHQVFVDALVDALVDTLVDTLATG